MELGKNLRRLRTERDMTQAELAARLNVTAQAVSKWECGDGYPEITLLPRLAAVFHVTTDALLGLDGTSGAEALDEAAFQSQRLIDSGQVEEGLARMRRSVSENPAAYPHRGQYAFMLEQQAARCEAGGDRAAARLYRQEAARQREHILLYADGLNRISAAQALVKLYYDLGEREKLLSLRLKPDVDITGCRIDLRTPDIAKGNDRVYAAQLAILQLVQNLLLMTDRLAGQPYETGPAVSRAPEPGEGDWAASPEERIRVLELGLAVCELALGRLRTTIVPLWMANSLHSIVDLALSVGDRDKALDSLLRLARLEAEMAGDEAGRALVKLSGAWYRLPSVAKAAEADQPARYTAALEALDPEERALLRAPISDSPFINHLSLANMRTQLLSAGEHAAAELRYLADARFDPLREEPRFQEAAALLQTAGQAGEQDRAALQREYRAAQPRHGKSAEKV